MFDRDGVLTQFHLPTLKAFFEPLVPLSVGEIGARWQSHCARTSSPRTLGEESEFWAEFWESLAAELDLPPSSRERLRAFDYTTVLRAHADAREALSAMRERGLRVGVLSNFPLASIEGSLRAAGLADLVDVFCCASVIGHAKPARQAYVAVLERLAVQPAECLFFDDERDCVEGARAVGLDAYLVDRHGTSTGSVPDARVVPGLASIERLVRARR